MLNQIGSGSSLKGVFPGCTSFSEENLSRNRVNSFPAGAGISKTNPSGLEARKRIKF
jgi:hypothetical protein